MNREESVNICEKGALETISRLFGTRKDQLKMFPAYEGAANLVYEYDLDGKATILRISFNQERTLAEIQAELHYINFLAENEVRVSQPIQSKNGNLVETIKVQGIPFYAVSFIKGKGMRVPDNGYRYRDDAPIEEYYQNWGQMLGKMHALTKRYQPMNDLIVRPNWFELHQPTRKIEDRIPDRFPLLRERIRSLLDEIQSLPKDYDGYGLIHGDFNDGNFTVDYTTGDITVFDFDDSCYFWFMYELASAWEGGIGRVMYRDVEERKDFMDHYMEEVMKGYHQENTLSTEWMSRLPLFIQLIQVEEILHYIQYINVPDVELQKRLGYKIFCIENQIPFKGFFDPIYSPEHPGSL